MLTVLRYHSAHPVTSACRVATGRSAVLLFAQRWRPETVFMPCYVPDGIISPFMAAGTHVVFYRLDAELRPDLAHLDQVMTENPGLRPVIVVVHYFGMVQPMIKLHDIAAKHEAILFSDCAHALLMNGPHTIYSDVSLISLNKFIPVADGAILSTRLRDLDLSIDESALPSVPPLPRAAYDMHLSANAEIVAAGAEKDISELLATSEAAYSEYYYFINKSMWPMAQSPESRAVEAMQNYKSMYLQRSQKSGYLDVLLSGLLVRPSGQDCQFAYPIRCFGLRDEIGAALARVGVLASTINDKWDHIPSGGFDIEAAFIDDHLLLPIGEAVTFPDLERMAAAIRSAMP